MTDNTQYTDINRGNTPLYKSLPDTETLIRDFDFGGTK